MSHDPHADPDMLRNTKVTPCPHDWHYIDRFDLLYCSRCRATLDPDDDPGDDAA